MWNENGKEKEKLGKKKEREKKIYCAFFGGIS
jgi:hypothetical protein